MPFVLDASVAMAWCFEDESTPETEAVLDRLTEDSAVVPMLWEIEIAKVVLVAERRGKLTEFQSTRFIEMLGRLPVNLDLAPPHVGALLAAGRRRNLSAYDAAYLLLAERDGLPLATQDRRLQTAAQKAGVPLLID